MKKKKTNEALIVVAPETLFGFCTYIIPRNYEEKKWNFMKFV